LTLTGAVDGLYGSSTANSTGLTVNNCAIFGNVSYGVFLDVTNDHATFSGDVVYGDLASNGTKQANGIYLNSGFNTITGNTVYDHSSTGIYNYAGTVGGTLVSGNLVYGNATGISMQQSTGITVLSTVSGNTVRNNLSTGIFAEAAVLVTGNTVYGQSATNAIGISTGYSGAYGGSVVNNVLYANYVGIETDYTGDTIRNNRLYNNSYAAIEADGSLPVLANDVYSNNIGILLGYNYNGQVDDNLVYANSTDGILMENYSGGGGQIVNNTVYQVAGSAVQLDSGAYNVELRNNILWVQAGYDIYVADNSQKGLNSDYNDLYTGSGSSANVGFWNSAVNNGVQSQLSNWQAATGQDAHSLSPNPDFVNITGADDLLGYTQVNGTYADYGQDDNFYLSAGSPAIDRGDSWNAPLTDIQGNTRQDDPGTPNQGSPNYFSAVASPAPAFPSGGVAQNWRGINTYFNYTLPFSFAFYGKTYTTVSVSTNGYLQFAGPDYAGDGSNPSAKLLSDARIAPLWASLVTNQTGDDIYVNTSVANQVTIRWAAANTADSSLVNFAVTLYSSGSIQFYYGAGNTNLTSTVGISAGNGFAYQLLPGYSGQATLTNAPSVLYTLQPGIVDLGAYEFRGSSLDTTPPRITSASPALANGGTYFSFTQLQASFSKPVSPIDANSKAVYELREAGSNGFGSPNDVVYSLMPLYNSNNNTVTLSINGLGSGTLPPGSYRFTIFSSGTDTIHDLSGNALDGDGDGVAGGNYVRTFTLIGAQPTVTGISPPAGPVGGGTSVTISGTNLLGVTAVNFGANQVAVLSENGTTITATSPAESAALVDVTLVTAGGTSAVNPPGDQFRYVAAPSARADVYSATQGSTLSIAAPGVLANDTDPQGYPLSALLVTNPSHGSVTLDSDGSFTYTPSQGYLGSDRFAYRVSDGYATSSPATVLISIGPATLLWTGTLLGNWTDAQWSGASLPYPNATADVTVDTPHVVQVTSGQTANALGISNGGQVAIGPGADLSVTTGTSVTSNGTLNVNPNGAFSTGGTMTLDTGGSLIGGPITAAAYQLNDGMASADLSGPDGLTKGTGGTVVLSGSDSYAGGTVVNAGTLIVTNAGALPDGTNLSIGAGGTFVFDPSQAASTSLAAGRAAPVPRTTVTSATSSPNIAASVPTNVRVPVLPLSATTAVYGAVQQVSAVAAPSSTHFRTDAAATPASMSQVATDAVLTSHRSAFDQTVSPADLAQSVRPWAWLAAIEGSWNSANQNKTTDSTVAALDQVLARFGV